MAGYWPGSSLSEIRKNRTTPISSHVDRTILVNKGFILWLLGKCFLRDTAGSSERVRARAPSILLARVANHSAGFDSSCPLTELAI